MERTAGSTSSTERRRTPAQAVGGVALGLVVGSHGLRGEIRVRVLVDDDSNLCRVPHVRLGRSEEDPEAVEYEVRIVGSGRGGEVRMALAGVESRDAAEALRGRLVLARSADLESLGPGEYYGFELVGCRVEDQAGRPIGVVKGIWGTGAPDVLVIESEGGEQKLVPAAESLLLEVDVERRRIVVDALPGLLDPA